MKFAEVTDFFLHAYRRGAGWLAGRSLAMVTDSKYPGTYLCEYRIYMYTRSCIKRVGWRICGE
jgi:hypothetical protein